MKSDYELLEGDKQIVKITVSELKHLIKECLRELEAEKQFSDKEYKALWIKPPTTTEGLSAMTKYYPNYVIRHDASCKEK